MSIGWKRTHGTWDATIRNITEQKGMRQNIVFSQITFVTSPSDSGAVFICEVSSIWFPDLSETCYAGPLIVLGTSSTSTLSTAYVTDTDTTSSPVLHSTSQIYDDDRRYDMTTIEDTGNVASGDDATCMPCPSSSFIDTVPWIVALVVGVLAALIILAIDISLYLKKDYLRKEFEIKKHAILPEIFYDASGAYVYTFPKTSLQRSRSLEQGGLLEKDNGTVVDVHVNYDVPLGVPYSTVPNGTVGVGDRTIDEIYASDES